MTDPSCNCIAAVDAKLAERNTRIRLPIILGADQTARPMIVTDQIESGRGKQKAVGMFASFCPWCGRSYSPEAPTNAQSPDRYAEAKALVLGSGKASCSFVQRKLGVGYNEAARYVERMETEAFVGPANNVGRREVLAVDLRETDRG